MCAPRPVGAQTIATSLLWTHGTRVEPIWRSCELALLYGALPLVFAGAVNRIGYRGAMFPILWIIALLCISVMLSDPAFDRASLWRLPLRHAHVTLMALRWLVLSSLLAIAVRLVSPRAFARFPRENPRFFAFFVVGYPFLSALPQGIIWRLFFAYRYASLFGTRTALVAAGAAAFALAHITFRNVLALLLTALGGAFFLDTYLTTGSMCLATLEHGAYGVAAFGLGLGEFLYLGARGRGAGRR